MKQPFEKPAYKKNSVGDRLNQLVASLSAVTDVWGLENKIHKSIGEYFTKISQEENVTTDQLCVIIRVKVNELRIWLWISETTLRPLATTQLLNSFGVPMVNPGAIEDQVKAFLNTISHQHAIPSHQIRINISFSNQKAIVRLYRDVDSICEIPMRDMLNHFLP